MPRIAEHAAHGADPAGDVEEQRPLDQRVRCIAGRDVGVHLGQRRE
jgi:hypothetical protein